MATETAQEWLDEHLRRTRRMFLQAGAGIATSSMLSLVGRADERDSPLWTAAISKLESWLTAQGDFQDVSRGRPKPHSLDDDQRVEAGLTRDTWRLQVTSDPDHPARLRRQLTGEQAFDFPQLMRLAQQHAVRFPKVMTCLNLGCPLGNGIWEGVPLREVLWQTEPQQNLRRVHYYGFHNHDPEQRFQSSLPVGRILEDPFDLPPVILCYKLNGEWLSPERGGPVRVVVPEAYGFKSIKWLQHVVLSNRSNANDTYANQNNDIDSPLKTFCATLTVPDRVAPQQPFMVTGYAQVGISGLQKVQVWLHAEDSPLPEGDRYFRQAPWRDAVLLDPPASWGGELKDRRMWRDTQGFDNQTGMPEKWPIRLSKAHWAFLHPGLPAGEYTLRSRTVDDKGIGQPLPRPFRKSGRAAIEKMRIRVG